MKSIDYDIEEYDGLHCDPSDNGFDNHQWDKEDYLLTAEQVGLIPINTDVL